MRFIIGCLLLIACAVLIVVPVSAQSRPLRQTHSIVIEVECVEAALEIIRELNGYNLESSVYMQEFFGRSPQRRANFTRRVEGWAFRHVQEVLRSLGEVQSETENAHFLGAQIMDVEARLVAISQEIERLSTMMAVSDSLDVLITIDQRLSQVTQERNQLIGRRNLLQAQAANPVIFIQLFEIPEDWPAPVPTGFGSRVANSFTDSWRGTRNVVANMLVFFVRVSIPLLVLCIWVSIAFVIYFRIKRRQAIPEGAIPLKPPMMEEVVIPFIGSDEAEKTGIEEADYADEKEGEA